MSNDHAKEPSQLEKIRHSLAHLLAATVRELYPGAKNAIGPSIDDGFYQDFELPQPITDGELAKIEKAMKKKLKEWKSFDRREVTPAEAKQEFSWNEYKCELIDEFAKDAKQLTFYTINGFIDLCKGGHAEHPAQEIAPDAFKLDRIAGAYWRGDEKNKMLTRIYGLAFATKAELDAHLLQREEAKKRDHRKLGKDQGLFVFSDLVGPGLPLYTPKGNAVRNEIIKYSRELNKKLGFGEVHTPNINKAELFRLSGHYDAYKEDMLSVRSQYVSDEMFLKPMNCPQHTQIYASELRSYRDLPVRYADFAVLYRDERPGELSGLTRLRAFSQDDGHIFCREDQISDEISAILDAIKEALATYRIDYWMRLSLRDPNNKAKYLGEDATWERSQKELRQLLIDKNIPYKEAEGEAAFYGPKIDIMAVDALGRQWQISTAQLDFVQPSRFKLEYVGEDGSRKTPVMIHRALVGSPDRFLGILIEHYAGAFPVWLAPQQVRIASVAERHIPFCVKLREQMMAQGIRTYLDDSNESVGKKIRNAEKMKVPYTLVVGDKEQESGSLAIRVRGQKDTTESSTADFMEKVKKESADRN
ncbi:MAG: threonine--tRNA ligase [Parcubacteria group bacterium]|nr:threonine--tRNA ligase [Parcubacteria group bacterium]